MSSHAVPRSPTDVPNRKRRYAIFFLIAAVGCLADLFTKHYMFQWLGRPNGLHIHWIVKDFFAFETALNHGALFGVGQNMVWFFALMSFVALMGIGYWLVKHGAIDEWILTLTLALVTGGILGNLYDRLGLWSNFEIFAVRDWIRFSYYQHVWPNFNIADCLLVCGAGLLFWHSLQAAPSSSTQDLPQTTEPAD